MGFPTSITTVHEVVEDARAVRHMLEAASGSGIRTVTPVLLFSLDSSSIVDAGSRMSAKFSAASSGCLLNGASRELKFSGNLFVEFEAGTCRISSLDVMYDTLSLALQVEAIMEESGGGTSGVSDESESGSTQEGIKNKADLNGAASAGGGDSSSRSSRSRSSVRTGQRPTQIPVISGNSAPLTIPRSSSPTFPRLPTPTDSDP